MDSSSRHARNRRIDLLGAPIDALSEQEVVVHVFDRLNTGDGGWVITSNLDHLRRSRIDAEFRAMLNCADLVVADGMPLVWAARVAGAPLPERVAGSSLVSTLAQAAAEQDRSIFLLGGDPGAAQGAADHLRGAYPKLRIAGAHCPPVGFEKDSQQMQAILAALKNTQPDLIYVALGSPKQEHLIQRIRHELPQAWWLGVGISLSFLSGQVRRAPRWMQRLGLEWLHRLVQEPGRLVKRYLFQGLPFAMVLFGSCLLQRLGAKRRGAPRRPPL